MTLRTMSPFAPCITWWLLFFEVLLFSSTCIALTGVEEQKVLRPRQPSREETYGKWLEDPLVTAQRPLSTLQPVDEPQDLASITLSGKPVFSALLDAIEVMQSHYFAIWQGTWPTAIDWTAAVMGTQVSATLSSISEGLVRSRAEPRERREAENEITQRHENLINRYFTQITSFYFGENAFALRTQAYDDMLWVVLGWLESVKFIKLHAQSHFRPFCDVEGIDYRDDELLSTRAQCQKVHWYAKQFIPQFAHRARIFYNLASQGWDTSLCGGGMVWNPYLAPYKNAITNQLFIAASVSMYLYFPGDDNSSPFSSEDRLKGYETLEDTPPAKAHDERYLTAAIDAYDWLKKSNMINSQGLYFDGFHITGWRGGKNATNGTGKCDLRDSKVYTYNQGVILSGLRGLWDATGNVDYLHNAHDLVRNVIAASGWPFRTNPRKRRMWQGLGRGGVLEEACDHSGSCGQDGQTFKGIFFHHLSLLCKPLVTRRNSDSVDDEIPKLASLETAALHGQSCKEYGPWIEWNARAAYATRDRDGRYGTWWGRHTHGDIVDEETSIEHDDEDIDYRNLGVPNDQIWRRTPFDWEENVNSQDDQQSCGKGRSCSPPPQTLRHQRAQDVYAEDYNDRGRGRTVETQSGGLAVVRALWDWRTWYRC